MKRPNNLPNYENPPLSEVVLGVQFDPIIGYSSILAADLWHIYRKEFPYYQEQPLLSPQIETFGGLNSPIGPKIQVGPQIPSSRLWFVSNDENYIIQFQRDRFLSNWRKSETNLYPRYEHVASEFQANFEKLQKYFEKKLNFKTLIKQAEITYINLVPVEEYSQVCKWFRIFDVDIANLESLYTGFDEVIYDEEKKPIARLSHDLQSVFDNRTKKQNFKLSLTYRGQPSGNDLLSTMSFLHEGRSNIVKRFDEITTKKAHKKWGKKDE